jgi:hypothetical protein
MHGLINRSIQSFVETTYGRPIWEKIAYAGGLDVSEFEAMLRYDDEVTLKLLDAASEVLERARGDLMEDIGTYLVSHPNTEAVRRLLRFGGVNFVDFLHSLDDLPDRVRLAVSELSFPKLELRAHGEDSFSLLCAAEIEGFGNLMMGVLRVMADDYGTLALLEHKGRIGANESLLITLVATDFSAGRLFDLGARAG